MEENASQSSGGSSNNSVVWAFVGGLVLIAGLVVWGFGQVDRSLTQSSVEEHDMTGHPAPAPASTSSTAAASSPASTSTVSAGGIVSPSAVREFTVHGTNFSFLPGEMRVKKGDKVKITFVNDTGFHDLVIDEFAAATPKIQGGQSAVVEFVADKTGEFEYYCSVGTHRQMGMRGVLVVE